MTDLCQIFVLRTEGADPGDADETSVCFAYGPELASLGPLSEMGEILQAVRRAADEAEAKWRAGEFDR
jgi:hypothetical protein